MRFRTAPVVAAALLISGCGLNSVPRAEEEVKARWADVQAAYQRRADLIPNLVATTKAAAGGSEATILRQVTEARAKAGAVQLSADQLDDPAKVQAFQNAQNGVTGALGQFRVTVEAYPQLGSQEAFRTLMHEIEGSESRIYIAVRDYNAAVQAFNTRIRTFPDAIGAKVFYGARPKVPFEAKKGAENAPEVNFGNNF